MKGKVVLQSRSNIFLSGQFYACLTKIVWSINRFCIACCNWLKHSMHNLYQNTSEKVNNLDAYFSYGFTVMRRQCICRYFISKNF